MTLNKKHIFGIIAVVILVAVGGIASAKKISPISLKLWGEINHSDGVALQGYDAVAYHTNSAATMGTTEHQAIWRGITWHFASVQNKALFQAAPETFAPQYANYCAFAVSKGVTAETDPTAWHVADNKLYLFNDQDVKAEWIAGNAVTASDANWID